MENNQRVASQERVINAANGWPMLGLFACLVLAAAIGIPLGAVRGQPALSILSALVLAFGVLMLTGLYSLQPNEARVLVLFGKYKGTVRASGLHWGNPFYSYGGVSIPSKADLAAFGSAVRASGRNKISLRARTLNGDPLKVNDKSGNPIEIAVVVWRVEDTARLPDGSIITKHT